MRPHLSHQRALVGGAGKALLASVNAYRAIFARVINPQHFCQSLCG
jgi:hypothetical protein